MKAKRVLLTTPYGLSTDRASHVLRRYVALLLEQSKSSEN